MPLSLNGTTLITGSQIGASAIGTDNIAGGAVTGVKLANNSVDYTKLPTTATPTAYSGSGTFSAGATETSTNVVNITLPKSGLLICSLHVLQELTNVATSALYWHLQIGGAPVVEYGGHRGTGATASYVNYDHWTQAGWTYIGNVSSGSNLKVISQVDNGGSWSVNNWKFIYIII